MTLIERLGKPSTLPSGDINPLSSVVCAGKLVFVSGLMPKNEHGQIARGSIERQTRIVMKRLKLALAEAQCTFADLLKVTVWLTRTRDFAGFNREYARALAGLALPARSAVRCDLLQAGARLEIEAIALRKPRSRARPLERSRVRGR